MIEPTDEMLAVFAAAKAAVKGCPGLDDGDDQGLAAVLALVERQVQERYGEAYQRGWWRGQHRLCPRCGVELEREVAAERQGREP